MNSTEVGQSVTPFKQAQLRHRRRGGNANRIENGAEWIDFGSQRKGDDRIIPITLPTVDQEGRQLYRGAVFGLKDFPGLLYAPQALSLELQKELAINAVSEYCESPHTTNIDLCPPKENEDVNTSAETMWDLWKKKLICEGKGPAAACPVGNSIAKKPNLDHSTHGTHKRKYRSFQKLSWSCMGYHYDWTERSYNKGRKSEMPSLVSELSVLFAKTFMSERNQDGTAPTLESRSFAPSGSIVNYYTAKSNMGGHRDDLEFALDKPIISLSMGLPAIFLLGGKTKDDELVVPILIRSGDVLCMGGDMRLNYHAMVRVLPAEAELPERDSISCGNHVQSVSLETLRRVPSSFEHDDDNALTHFLSSHRINITVRQVYQDKDEDDQGTTL